ncbi:MAG: 4Fe-4S binding protein [Oscillospiraceae bacterium]|nr:4Fe-4S binding protein [Oscillospiraceae bacterium]MCD7792438.1 4Fe-4S binding protein [Oscillospiraceae bacterium]MCD8016486.1 4Fe-4S binding protein [Oscillospiraceae bacterium]MCD8065971.1 4Fe-4S binding protein [Oscillospiraceae bacterium]MCD8100750.1 4Fe-4S binding protein [Oscillospiraceae bacterium]
MNMAKLTFRTELCKGCGLCVEACPRGLIELSRTQLNKNGHSPAEMTDETRCIGCAFCAIMCPDCVITVER